MGCAIVPATESWTRLDANAVRRLEESEWETVATQGSRGIRVFPVTSGANAERTLHGRSNGATPTHPVFRLQGNSFRAASSSSL